MKKFFLTLVLFTLCILSHAKPFEFDTLHIDFLDTTEYKVITDQKYGEFDRNVFDFISPKTEGPHALVIYIHGGGFLFGDKSFFYKRKDDINYLLEHNIAVATINYRFSLNDDSLGVKLCLHDVQTAIQYFRYNAEKYHIDKTRIGSYGISAGAGSSLYFAFHDDLAIPGDKTFRGESTKLKCIGAIDTQATYDVFGWKKIVPGLRLGIMLKHKFFYNMAANFYGFPNYKSFKPYKKEISESLDMLAMIDENDPPVYLMNLLDKTVPVNDYVIQHHKKHAQTVAKVLNKNNVEYYLYTKKNAKNEADIDYKIAQYFVEHL